MRVVGGNSISTSHLNISVLLFTPYLQNNRIIYKCKFLPYFSIPIVAGYIVSLTSSYIHEYQAIINYCSSIIILNFSTCPGHQYSRNEADYFIANTGTKLYYITTVTCCGFVFLNVNMSLDRKSRGTYFLDEVTSNKCQVARYLIF